MFEGFVNPALAFGTALAAVPLIIHLLNRQRHKPVRWAAMRFVLAAYKKTRRRVQLENLLLLLLRIAAVALLALAVARPFASGDSPLAKLTEDRRDVVLVLDGSASTGYREDVDTVFERIVRRANEIASSLDGPRGDRVRVILAGDHPRLLSWTTPDKALAVLSTLTIPTDEALDLTAALDEVHDAVEKDAAGTGQSALEVRLLTDLQRRAFEAELAESEPDESATEDEPTAPLLVEQLDALSAFGVRVLVEDLGPSAVRPPNLSVASVAPLHPVLGPGVPVEIAVTVANHGPAARAAVRVALEVDGARQPSQRLDVPARGTAQAVFSLHFPSAGPHALLARLEGDRLAIDDARPHVLHVPPPIRVLVVNGARASRIEEDEAGYLMAVLEPPDDGSLGGGLSPFDPREVTPEVLGSADLDLAPFDVILLANVASPSFTDDVVASLEEHVAAGASLILTLGDRLGAGLDRSDYNRKLTRGDGSGLLPAELTRRVRVASRRDSYYRVANFDEDHPALTFFADDRWKPLLTEVPVYEFVASRPLEGSKVVARLDDEAKSALLIERRYDEGRVLLWTTTIDPGWTRLPESPRTLVPLVHELVRYAGTRRARPHNLRPGEPARLEVAAFPRSPELVRPDSSRRPLEGEATEARRGRWLLPEVPGSETERAGLYRVDLDAMASQPFAVQIDPSEGDLERMLAPEIAALHPALVPLARGAETTRPDGNDAPRRGEVWRWLALFALLALVGESLWAARLGYKRRVAT